MEYVKFGSTGMDVSRLCLGMMSYGDASRGGHQWVLAEDEARPFIKRALELGVNFFDTANVSRTFDRQTSTTVRSRRFPTEKRFWLWLGPCAVG